MSTELQSHRQRKPRRKDRKQKPNVDQIIKKAVGKSIQQMKFESTHSLMITPRYSSHQKMHFVRDVLRNKFAPATGLKTISAEDIQAMKDFRRELTSYVFGTQEPSLKLHTVVSNINSTGGSQVNTVWSQGWPIVAEVADFATCFEEVRVTKGTVHYLPYLSSHATVSNAVTQAVGVIDYNSVGAFTNYTDALPYDTCKIFRLENGFCGEAETKWKWHAQGQPDLAWISTADTTTFVCHFKTFGLSTIVASTLYGYLFASIYVRFRQVS
jgi:hypothetical protein